MRSVVATLCVLVACLFAGGYGLCARIEWLEKRVPAVHQSLDYRIASVECDVKDNASRFDMVGVMKVSQPGDEMWFTPNGQGKVFQCVTPRFGGWGETKGALVRISGVIDRKDGREVLSIEDLENIRVPETVSHINWASRQ